MNQSIPARRRAALHAIRLASMRLDKGVPAETFAQEIDELMAAVRAEALEQTLARMSTSAELALLNPTLVTEKSAPFEPDWPNPHGHYPGTPPTDGLGLSPAPLNVPRRGGTPKLSDEQKVELQRRYCEVTAGGESTPRGWAKDRAAEHGVSVGTIYAALAPVMTDLMTARAAAGKKPTGRPRIREVDGSYGTTAARERGPMA